MVSYPYAYHKILIFFLNPLLIIFIIISIRHLYNHQLLEQHLRQMKLTYLIQEYLIVSPKVLNQQLLFQINYLNILNIQNKVQLKIQDLEYSLNIFLRVSDITFYLQLYL